MNARLKLNIKKNRFSINFFTLYRSMDCKSKCKLCNKSYNRMKLIVKNRSKFNYRMIVCKSTIKFKGN